MGIAGVKRATQARLERPYIEGRIIDLAHKDVVADPMGSIRRISDRFALPFSDEHAARIRRFLAANPAASRLGKHRHRPAQLGRDAAEVPERRSESFIRFAHLIDRADSKDHYPLVFPTVSAFAGPIPYRTPVE